MPDRFLFPSPQPLRNKSAMFKLNPYAKVVRESEMKAEAARAVARAAAVKAKRGVPVAAEKKKTSTRFSKARRAASRAFIAAVKSDDFVTPAAAAAAKKIKA